MSNVVSVGGVGNLQRALVIVKATRFAPSAESDHDDTNTTDKSVLPVRHNFP